MTATAPRSVPRPGRLRRRLASGLIAGLSATALALPMTTPALASEAPAMVEAPVTAEVMARAAAASPGRVVNESFPRPADGTFDISGRGFGHGIGMSQYGAQARALAGHTFEQILHFYYPGAVRSALRGGDATQVRVWIEEDTDQYLTVLPEAGLTLTNLSGESLVLPTDAKYVRWQIRRLNGVTSLRWIGANGAGTVMPTGFTSNDSLGFHTADDSVTLYIGPGSMTLRGTVRARLDSAGRQRTVNYVTLQHYLRSVVPSESPASWRAAALEAQTVAARTFVTERMERTTNASAYDICNSQTCQVYSGMRNEYASTNAAVDATAGVVLRDAAGRPALTMFSSSNGGWTVGANGYDYLNARTDAFDDDVNPYAKWTYAAPVTSLERSWPAIGALRRLTVVKRDGRGMYGGRVLEADLVGSQGTVRVTGDQLRRAWGLRSTWFSIGGARAEGKTVTGTTAPDLVIVDRYLTPYAAPGYAGNSLPALTKIGSPLTGYNMNLNAGAFDLRGGHDLLQRNGSGQLSLLSRNTSNTGWMSRTVVGTGFDRYRLLTAVGDLDGDAKPDLIGVRASDGVMELRRGTGFGKVSAPVVMTPWFSGYKAITGVGDMNSDGYSDFVGVAENGELKFFAGDGKGGRKTGVTFARVATGFRGITGVGDYNGDGFMDVAEVSGSAVYLHRGNGAGGTLGRTLLRTGLTGYAPLR